MKELLCTVLCLVMLTACLLGAALHGFEAAALDPAEYDRLQKELDVYDYAGMNADALSRVNRLLADYLTGRAESLSVEEEVFGVRRQVFNLTEKAHMVDVLNLFRLAHGLKIGLLTAAALLLAAFVIAARPRVMPILIRAFIWLLCGTGTVLLAGVILSFTLGFDRLFILFHELFFSNDLWLMDPRTDILVRMFPGEFFRRIALDAGLSAGRYVLCALGAILFICGTVFRSTFGRKQIS